MKRKSYFRAAVLVFCLLVAGFLRAESAAQEHFVALAETPAAEARQGTAVDAAFFYAIDNEAVGKYDRVTGARVASWVAPEGSNIEHLNSGVVIDGKLYSAHSNYPEVPMISSIEIWDTQSLQHLGSHSFGIYEGSATWVDFFADSWWVAFAHYGGRGGVPGKGPEWTRIVQFDEHWNRQAGWALPQEVIEEMAPYSNSGGAWDRDGSLYLTGHDAAMVYRVRLPADGSRLVLMERIPAPIEGQGIALDHGASSPTLYGLKRSSRTIVRAELVPLSVSPEEQ